MRKNNCFLILIVLSLTYFSCLGRRTSYEEARTIFEKNKQMLQQYAEDIKEQKRYHEIVRINEFNETYIPFLGTKYIIYLEIPGESGYKRYEIELDEGRFEVKKESKDIFIENNISEQFFVKYAKFLDDLDFFAITNYHKLDQVELSINSIDGIIYKYGDYYDGKIINPTATEIKKIDDNWYYFREYE